MSASRALRRRLMGRVARAHCAPVPPSDMQPSLPPPAVRAMAEHIAEAICSGHTARVSDEMAAASGVSVQDFARLAGLWAVRVEATGAEPAGWELGRRRLAVVR